MSVPARVAAAIHACRKRVAGLEDLRQRLLAAFPALPRDRLGEVLAMGLTAAELAGRFDASGR